MVFFLENSRDFWTGDLLCNRTYLRFLFIGLLQTDMFVKLIHKFPSAEIPMMALLSLEKISGVLSEISLLTILKIKVSSTMSEPFFSEKCLRHELETSRLWAFTFVWTSMLVLLLVDEFINAGQLLEANEWSEPLVFLLKDIWILEVLLELGGSLNGCVLHLTHLHWVKSVPSAAIELLIKVRDELATDEIQKRVTNVATAL